MSKGYELIHELPLLENAEQVAEDAVALLNAPQYPGGQKDIILQPTQLFMQSHDSVGQPPGCIGPLMKTNVGAKSKVYIIFPC